jgi:hypothetical protein
MNAPHQMVSLDKASPGMILSDAILDQQGQVLLAQGTVLTDTTLAALARHDVAMVPVAVPADAAPPVDAAAITARIDYLFRGDGSELDAGPFDTATALLHRYITDYRLGGEVAP